MIERGPSHDGRLQYHVQNGLSIYSPFQSLYYSTYFIRRFKVNNEIPLIQVSWCCYDALDANKYELFILQRIHKLHTVMADPLLSTLIICSDTIESRSQGHEQRTH